MRKQTTLSPTDEDKEKRQEMRKRGREEKEATSSTCRREEEKQLIRVTEQSKPNRAGVRFAVASVTPCRAALQSTSHRQIITTRIKGKIESCFHSYANIISTDTLHALIQAVHLAYDKHYPLVLSPDMIWLCITQGLAIHINQNSGQQRDTCQIKVRRDDFVKDFADNSWLDVIDEISQRVKEKIGKRTCDLITPNFSTTGLKEKAVCSIALMDAVRSFTKCSLTCQCGIPSITLEGAKEDWAAVRRKAEQLEQYDLKQWTEELLPILDQFVSASSGKIDRKFWSNIYKLQNEPGGPYVSGWITTLFPYLEYPRDVVESGYLRRWSVPGLRCGFNADTFTSGLSKVPIVWEYLVQPFNMQFIGGFMAVSQDKRTLALRPEIGWAVVQDGSYTV
ncbi:uncharacterized protein [Ptychodera flava]|uniref:uncharacterized protein n=1 Tax=Ptychodera flava TaxID=63121 RepID=UPI00396A43D3